MKEKVTYQLLTVISGKNPDECQIYEEFRDKQEKLARIMMEKVPRKRLYVILKQEKDYFPEVLDACSNIRSASNKVLEYTLEYVFKRINQDNEKLPLLLESAIDNRTVYDKQRFNRVWKRLKNLNKGVPIP